MNLKKEIKLSDLVPRRPEPKGSRPSRVADAPGKRRPGLRGRAATEVVGLKIGASQLAASRVANNGSARLLQLAREPLPHGVVSGGNVVDVDTLATSLNSFFTKHSLPRKCVRLGVATNRIGVRGFDLPGVDDDRQLANAVRFRAYEAVSIPLEEAVLDYRVVGETVDASGAATRRIVVAAAYRESIDRYVSACRQARIRLVGIDLEAFALLRAVAPPVEGEADGPVAAVVAVTVGHDRTTLAISDGVVCDFTRVLEWGGYQLTTAVGRALRVSAEEAEEVKRSLTLRAPASDEDPRVTAARDAVRAELQTLARELVASLHFYQSQPGSLAIGDILVAGGTTRLEGFPEELERLTRVRVCRADPSVRVAVGDGVEAAQDLPSYAVAIGLGVEL